MQMLVREEMFSVEGRDLGTFPAQLGPSLTYQVTYIFLCFKVWTYFNNYHYHHIFYKRNSLSPQCESSPSSI